MATKKKRAFSWNRVCDLSVKVLAILYTVIYLLFFAGELAGDFLEKGSVDLDMWSTRDLVMLIFGPVTFIVSTVLMFSWRKVSGTVFLSGACILLAVSPWTGLFSWGFFIAYIFPMVIIGMELLFVNSVVKPAANESPPK